MSSRRELANAIRALSMDAVQKANSGHPGAPMGMADIAEVLWNDYLNHNPANPDWSNRDRFVLSNGHGSMLLYSLLHLSGYELSIEDLKNFRQLNSKTPGHPEYGHAPGVETTTGPLGQGIANAVGMAIAEKALAGQFNKGEHEIVDHFTYAFCGDGCLMEGVSHEACSLAGTLGLGKLILIYDDNGISIDGEVEGWFTDDTPARFEAYGWQVIRNVDGHDSVEIATALDTARAESSRPTLVCCKTVIGYGSPNKQGKESSHGSPLGEDEVALAREQLEWSHPPFEIPEGIYTGWNAQERGAVAEDKWNARFESYRADYPELAAEYERRVQGAISDEFEQVADRYIRQCQADAEKLASRKASQNCIEQFATAVPEFLGGSADLAGSNLTLWSGSETITGADPAGNYLNYGVREFGMTAIMNGISLHGGFIPYGGTFLIFMEYARNAVRVASLMGQRVILVYTHDSIGLGEDGPTHQPVEQLTTLRSTPNLETWRPCDTVETAVAWRESVRRHSGPTALALSRQGLPCQARSDDQLDLIERGGYVLADCVGIPDLILIATGSEVDLAVRAKQILDDKGHAVRVVSMPCAERFSSEDAEYRETVLPSDVASRIAIEAGHRDYWHKFVGFDGRIIGMDSFGASAPGEELMDLFGFNVDTVVATAEELLD